MLTNPKNEKYFIELRHRSLLLAVSFLLVFSICFIFSKNLYSWFTAPLQHALPAGHHLIATHLTTPIFVPLQFATYLSLFLLCPFFLHQLWCFISPALHKKERRYLWPIFLCSLLLFYGGACFSYGILFPLLFKFLVSFTPSDIDLLPDMEGYLSFATGLLFLFGAIFQIPLVIFLTVKWQLVSLAHLRKARPYIIISAFTLGMLFTPPDVISQCLVAFPMWFLYEVGLLAAYCLSQNKAEG